MLEFRYIFGAWLLAQIFIVPFVVIGRDIKLGLISDFIGLMIVVIIFVGLKLLGM